MACVVEGSDVVELTVTSGLGDRVVTISGIGDRVVTISGIGGCVNSVGGITGTTGISSIVGLLSLHILNK